MTIATAARICTSTQRGFFWPFVLSCRIEIQVFIFWSADQTDSDREWRWGRRYGFSLVDYQIVGYIIIRKKENQYWLSKIIWKVFLCLNSKGPARCLENHCKNVSFCNIASVASYVFIPFSRWFLAPKLSKHFEENNFDCFCTKIQIFICAKKATCRVISAIFEKKKN